MSIVACQAQIDCGEDGYYLFGMRITLILDEINNDLFRPKYSQSSSGRNIAVVSMS